MRRGLAWLAGALGIAALLRALRRRHAEPADASPAPDPADELRAAIAETREDEAAEPAAEETPPPASLEERRRAVHERAQEAIEAMREPPPGA